jgi:hypothetical protein
MLGFPPGHCFVQAKEGHTGTEEESSTEQRQQSPKGWTTKRTRVDLATTGATMGHANQHFQGVGHSGPGGALGELGNEPDAACIFVVVGIKQALGLGDGRVLANNLIRVMEWFHVGSRKKKKKQKYTEQNEIN